MFSKNLKYYRLRNGMSKTELAKKANLTAMAITNYEKGNRMPNMDVLNDLANALDVRVMDFLAARSENIKYKHAEFRKNTKLTKSDQDYIKESVEEYFDRFMTAVDLLGGDVLSNAPSCHSLILSGDIEENAKTLRLHLGFSEDGPIEDLIGKLENKGILVYECDLNRNFSGMNGFVNDHPYIALNPVMTTERNRSTAVHELAHLMFIWPDDMDEKDIEKTATAIAGAFLFPKTDALRELGIKRTSIASDMVSVAKEYGISMMLLVKRASVCNIISKSVEQDFYVKASRAGWRTSEPSRIESEKPTLFSQFVIRSVNEEEISIQRGAELLHTSYDDMQKMCQFTEV